jgi:glutamyl-Q tRNA(Asp) synthetase
LPAGSSDTVTRFAPSPSGYLHLGHAHSALFAWRAARRTGGRFLLRIEDIDNPRSDPAFIDAIQEDLHWLGLDWDGPVWRQSARMDSYAAALERLRARGLLYPCFCSRAEIRAEIAASGQAPHGPAGPLYPGTCRELAKDERATRMAAGQAYGLRLDIARAVALSGALSWTDLGRGEIRADPLAHGDVVLARKDIATSYHLAVTLDDAAQGVTLVTRGEDLFPLTDVHRLLQALLGLPVPQWHHHGLLNDDKGQRLAKRHDALSLRRLRAAGKSPAEVRAMAGFAE